MLNDAWYQREWLGTGRCTIAERRMALKTLPTGRHEKPAGKILSVKIPPEKIASAETTTNKRYQGIIKAAG